MALKMVLGTPLSEIVAYRKVGKAYYGLLDVLCSNHADVIAQCDTATFTFLVNSLDAGLKGLDPSISSQVGSKISSPSGIKPHGCIRMHATLPTPPDGVARTLLAHLLCGIASPRAPPSSEVEEHGCCLSLQLGLSCFVPLAEALQPAAADR